MFLSASFPCIKQFPHETNGDESNNQYLLSIYYMSDTVICASCILTHLSFTVTSQVYKDD